MVLNQYCLFIEEIVYIFSYLEFMSGISVMRSLAQP